MESESEYKPRRSRIHIVYDILVCCRRFPCYKYLIYRRVSFFRTGLDLFLVDMEKWGLIKCSITNRKCVFETTEKGLRFIEVYETLLKLAM